VSKTKQKNSKQSTSSSKIPLILVTLWSVVSIFLIIWFLYSNLPKAQPSINTPVSTLSDIQWDSDIPIIYFMTADSNNNQTNIYSITADGSNKKLLYTQNNTSYNLTFTLLQKSNALLVLDMDSITLIDTQTNTSREVYKVPPTKALPSSIYISPNEEMLAVVSSIGSDLAIINLKTTESQYFPNYMNNDYSNQNISWSKDGTKLMIRNRAENIPDYPNNFNYYKYQIGSKALESMDADEFSMTLRHSDHRFGRVFMGSFNPSTRNSRAEIVSRKGNAIYVDETEIFKWEEVTFKGTNYCYNPFWIDDLHFLIQCGNEIRVVNVPMRKVAVLAEGDDPIFLQDGGE
jgi:hypothetical protein